RGKKGSGHEVGGGCDEAPRRGTAMLRQIPFTNPTHFRSRRPLHFVASMIPLLPLLSMLGISATPAPPLDAGRLRLALEKLPVAGSVLYVAAHPDDENTTLLAWLANEKKLRAGYLAVTRGDGGQNLVGPELGDLLGVIRTQELLAARRVDG